MKNLVVASLLAAVGSSAALTAEPAEPSSVDRPSTASRATLTLAGASAVMAGAEAHCRVVGAAPAIAIVDDAGNLVMVHRLDGAFPAGAGVAMGKARTAAMFRKSTSAFETIIRDGRTPMLALNDFTPLQGGVPIVVGGEVVGAIGVSGAASAAQDEEVASVGASALGAAVSGGSH